MLILLLIIFPLLGSVLVCLNNIFNIKYSMELLDKNTINMDLKKIFVIYSNFNKLYYKSMHCVAPRISEVNIGHPLPEGNWDDQLVWAKTNHGRFFLADIELLNHVTIGNRNATSFSWIWKLKAPPNGFKHSVAFGLG